MEETISKVLLILNRSVVIYTQLHSDRQACLFFFFFLPGLVSNQERERTLSSVLSIDAYTGIWSSFIVSQHCQIFINENEQISSAIQMVSNVIFSSVLGLCLQTISCTGF